MGRDPGAVVLCSDVVRKRLMGVAPTQILGPEGYTAEMTRRVFAAMAGVATRTLRSGQAVILDVVAARPAERAAFAEAAAPAGAPFTGIWLEAPAMLRSVRVVARIGGASDAAAAVVAQQEGFDLGPMEWRCVSARAAPEDIHADILAALLQ